MTQIERIGRFEVLERIRGNSFSLVYRGRDPFADRAVEIKVCVARDEAIRKKFLLAAEDAAPLRHTSIATIYEFGSGESKPYLVQEAFSECSLSDLLAGGDHVEDVLKLFYLVQVASGLQHAHRNGVLHRELRPASILVHEDGRAKITDFGTARLASAAAHLGNGAHRWPAVGWLLPELLLGLELDARSDVYGFGALSYELLTGEPPFASETLGELVPRILECEPAPTSSGWPDCPPELEQIISRCLRRDPSQRYPHISALIEDLSAVLPVPDADDIEEEEKTIVTTDLQTIYVADREEPEQENAPEPVPPTQPKVSTWVDTSLELGRHAKVAAMDGLAACISLARKVSVPKISTPRSWRPALIVGLAIALFGVVAWSLMRKPEQVVAVEPSPTRPVLEAVDQSAPGLLIIDAQPWAEVSRLVNDKGEEIALPQNPYTPLPLKLPPGRYLATLQRPSALDSQRCEALVSETTAGVCKPEIGDVIEANDYFRETGWWQ
jgi:serine/threonine protein kinase